VKLLLALQLAEAVVRVAWVSLMLMMSVAERNRLGEVDVWSLSVNEAVESRGNPSYQNFFSIQVYDPQAQWPSRTDVFFPGTISARSQDDQGERSYIFM